MYAIPARGEWVRNQEKLTLEDYQPYVESFDPIDYNPRVWAKLANGFLTQVSQINRGGEDLQRSGYRVISQFGMELLGQLKAALEVV